MGSISGDDEMICLFQTPTSEKTGVFHILQGVSNTHCSSICRSADYWFGGYNNDKPNQTYKNMKRAVYDGSQNLCPSCVRQAYVDGLINVVDKYND